MWHTTPMEGDKRFSARVAEGEDPGPAIVAAARAAEAFASACAMAEADAAKLLVCVEELMSNALRHGRAEEIELELRSRAEGIEIVLRDDGAAFDPSSAADFAGPDRLSGGGVGLELVRRWAREMVYSREEGRNALRLLLPPS